MSHLVAATTSGILSPSFALALQLTAIHATHLRRKLHMINRQHLGVRLLLPQRQPHPPLMQTASGGRLKTKLGDRTGEF